MKRIVDGGLYDTGTAAMVANGEMSDYEKLCNVSERLYVKRTGEYFLVGKDVTGSRVIPVTKNQACVWAESRLNADKYLDLFGVK